MGPTKTFLLKVSPAITNAPLALCIQRGTTGDLALLTLKFVLWNPPKVQPATLYRCRTCLGLDPTTRSVLWVVVAVVGASSVRNTQEWVPRCS